MSVWELYTQLFARNWRCWGFALSLSQRCSEKIRKKDAVMTAGKWSSWSIQTPQFLILWWPAIKSWIYCYDPETKRQSSQWKHADSPRRPDRANPPPNFWRSLFFFESTGMIYMHWVPAGQTVNKEYYVEVLREFRKRFRRKRPHSLNRLSGISTRTMPLSTTPSLSQTIWPRLASRPFVSLPTVQTLLAVTFTYSQSPEAAILRQLKIWKRLWRRSLTRSHKRTSMGPSGNCWNGTTSAF